MLRYRLFGSAGLFLLAVFAFCLVADAGDLGIFRVFQRRPPPTCNDTEAERLAKEIDWLESLIETYGTVVPKQPDVWGQARLTRHRHQVENELAKDLDGFRETLNASIRRSDQSFLGAALTISAALDSDTDVPSQETINTTLNLVAPPEGAIQRTEAGGLPPPFVVTSLGEKAEKIEGISLEPTVVLEQKFRYLALLNELRRINEGDDTSDAPGYSLNLVRIPISVLPGQMTHKGFGAEITFTAHPHLTPELLPNTFRSLVINDIVDLFALPGQKVLDHPTLVNDLRESLANRIKNKKLKCGPPEQVVESTKEKEAERAERESEADITETLVNMGVAEFAGTLVSGRSTQPLLPFPPAHMIDIFGPRDVFAPIVIDGVASLRPHPVNKNYPHLPDIEAFLRSELDSAYQFLAQPEAAFLWEKYCTPELVSTIRQRRRFVSGNLYDLIEPITDQLDPTYRPIRHIRNEFFDDILCHFPRAAYSSTVSLAWAIIVDSALLNARLVEDMQKIAVERNTPEVGAIPLWPDFYLPNPSMEARGAFINYVGCRWPVQVFALDPVTDEQNVADAYSSRREMQLAAAVALASGQMSANAAFQFVRRLEEDIETIALNRKAVAFAHGHDTFGWRFYPRIQTPRTPNNAEVLLQTVFGTGDKDLRELEPGIREVSAVVLMPSFVPFLEIDSRANWFKLCDPKKKELTLHDALKVSRTFQSVRVAAPALCFGDCYRGEDLAWLTKTVDQLERKLPLQSTLVPIPYENTLGGFEMFNSGITDLAPSLAGWYGAPGITLGTPTVACTCPEANKPPCSVNGVMPYAGVENYGGPHCAGTCFGTTLFLVGNQFSVHDTKVIAGGRCVPFDLISRQIMRVTIPPNVQYLEEGERHVVDVYVATPYGVSNHLLVRGLKPGEPAKPPERKGFAWHDKSRKFSATLTPILCKNPPYFKLIYVAPAPVNLVLDNKSGYPTPPSGTVQGLVSAVIGGKEKPALPQNLWVEYPAD